MPLLKDAAQFNENRMLLKLFLTILLLMAFYLVLDIVCTEPNIAGKIALSVILTFIFTILIGAIVWRCAFRRRYGELLSYAKQRENYEDMEELH